MGALIGALEAYGGSGRYDGRGKDIVYEDRSEGECPYSMKEAAEVEADMVRDESRNSCSSAGGGRSALNGGD